MSLLRAREAFTAMVDGVPASVSAGEVVDSGDPLVKGREGFFEEVQASEASRARAKSGTPDADAANPDRSGAFRRRVRETRTEAATAAPGELRDVHPVVDEQQKK